MIRAVIVEDEKKSQEALIALLSRHCKQVDVIGVAEGVREALDLIPEKNPDVIFLDIQMPDGSGFKLLELLDKHNFEVVFVTAYDQYAIKAIKYSALDYLLKPVIPEDLIRAVEKVETRKQTLRLNQNIKVLLENLRSSREKPSKIVLNTAEQIHVVDIDTIIRCESDNYYTRFFFTNNKTLLISRTLKENEELLSEYGFIRPHKSHLVNLKYIKGYSKVDQGQILMTDGTLIPVSRRKREKVVEIITNL
jgi:two-component system LytT family response regulator